MIENKLRLYTFKSEANKDQINLSFKRGKQAWFFAPSFIEDIKVEIIEFMQKIDEVEVYAHMEVPYRNSTKLEEVRITINDLRKTTNKELFKYLNL